MISVGLDIGQRRDPTALCVFEGKAETAIEPARTHRDPGGITTISQDRTPRARTRTIYVLRHLERLPLDTGFPDVARHVAGVLAALWKRTGQAAELYVDQTGHMSFVAMLREQLARVPHRMVPVTLTASDRCDRTVYQGYEEWRVGKAWLVSRMQVLMQTQRLQIPAGHREGRALQDELRVFEIRSTGRHDEFGAQGSGKHDDLVIAAGLGSMGEPHVAAAVIDPGAERGGRWRDWR